MKAPARNGARRKCCQAMRAVKSWRWNTLRGLGQSMSLATSSLLIERSSVNTRINNIQSTKSKLSFTCFDSETKIECASRWKQGATKSRELCFDNANNIATAMNECKQMTEKQ
jgi:hypothetical protein